MQKKNCGNGLKDLSGGTDEPSTLSGSISWEHLVPLLLISGGTAVKWSNGSCGQKRMLGLMTSPVSSPLFPTDAKKTRHVTLSYFVTHIFTNHTFPFFSEDVKKRLLIILWETSRIFGHNSKMLSPLIMLPDYFLYSSVVWWCSK